MKRSSRLLWFVGIANSLAFLWPGNSEVDWWALVNFVLASLCLSKGIHDAIERPRKERA